MKQLYKFSSNYFLKGVGAALIFCTLTWKTASANTYSSGFLTILTAAADTIIPTIRTDRNRNFIPLRADTTKPRPDSSVTRTKTDTFSLRISKDSLVAPLRYTAEDSAVVMVKDKKILLYGKTKTDYTDISLTAPKVEFDQQTQIVTAVNKKDSTGAIVENAHFKSAASEFTSDTIRYNMKTQK
ncbi:MAG TPA: hypothetical protein VLJ68_10235, partial [Chitinophagaceae bacterium]|nr:hypothetical protein [Chitinophagaceae bacterium]